MSPPHPAPATRGWCPGAHRPMRSGDGLIVRVRPVRAEMSAAQAQGLAHLAIRHGNATIDLTSRANLQIRGVSEAGYPALLRDLQALDLVDHTPGLEARRNILIAPDWQAGDLTDRLHGALLKTLPHLPALPMKMGHVLDTGGAAYLQAGSGDFRFECDTEGGLLLRADGTALGRPVCEAGAMDALLALCDWFVATGGIESGRMARHLRRTALPAQWQQRAPRPAAPPLQPGPAQGGLILGAPFGTIDAAALARLLRQSGARALRLMTGRLFVLRGAGLTDAGKIAGSFVSTPDDPRLDVHACPGAPACPQASVATRTLATQLAGKAAGTLHVSGCAKGCALPRPADVTLVGRDGHFDLVRGGAPWEPPHATGLRPAQINELSGIPDAI